MITVRNAEAIWTPLAGPEAARHYKHLLVWNRRSAVVAACSIGMGLLAGLMMRFHHTVAANVLFATALVGLAVMLPLVVNRMREFFRFRVAALEFLNVTPEERPGFACLTPDVMAAWIAHHRPSTEVDLHPSPSDEGPALMSDTGFLWFERRAAERYMRGSHSGDNAVGSAILLKDGPDALIYFAGMAAMVWVIVAAMVPILVAVAIVSALATKTATYWTAALLITAMLVPLGWLDWRFVQYSKARRRFRAASE